MNAHLLLLFLHLLFVVLAFGAVLVVDIFGVLWLTKRTPLTTVNRVASTAQVLIWIGLLGLIVTGRPLIATIPHISNLLKLKLFLVILLTLNGILMHFIKRDLQLVKDVSSVHPLLYFRIGYSTVISQIGWWGTIIIGFLGHELKKDTPRLVTFWPIVVYASLGLVIVYALGLGIIGKISKNR